MSSLNYVPPKRSIGALFTAAISTIYDLVMSCNDVSAVINNGTSYARRSSDAWAINALDEQELEYAENRLALQAKLKERKLQLENKPE